MCPLTLGNPSGEVPGEFTQLLKFLASRPQPAVVHYAAEGSRVELSGRVLANWATKLIGLFSEEPGLSPGDPVVLDMAVHWKAAAAALAVGAMGAELTLGAPGEEEPALVITDRPGGWVTGTALGQAELAAVSHGMLDSSFAEAGGDPLPAWVVDVSAEVRQQPDQLMVPLPTVPLPPVPEQDAAAAGPLLVTDWQAHSVPQMLGTWAAGGVVVLFDAEPGGEVWQQMRRNEGLSGGPGGAGTTPEETD